jgi:hypothetical protein
MMMLTPLHWKVCSPAETDVCFVLAHEMVLGLLYLLPASHNICMCCLSTCSCLAVLPG